MIYNTQDWPALPPLSTLVNRVHCMDALALLELLPDASVDAVFSDTPYGTTNLKWDVLPDFAAFWLQVRRIRKSPKSPTILFSAQPFTTDLICSNRAEFRYELIWEKSTVTGFLDANRRPLRNHENIIIFAENMPEYEPQMDVGTSYRANRANRASHYGSHKPAVTISNGTRYPRSVWEFSLDNDKDHPTQKPLALMERLILTYTAPDALIVDPFAGSGTTALAARNTGRRFIAGDISPEYVAIAEKRLAQPYTVPMFEAVSS